MKKFLSTVLTIVLLFSATSLFAQKEEKKKERYEHFKERNISKTYPASGNILIVDNSFGSVKVITGGSEIKVDIHIEASSTDATMAERTYNKIDVKDWKEGNSVHFKTSTGSNDKGKGESYSCNNCKSNMSIDYEIHIPSGTTLNIKNQFGSTDVPDYNGKITLESQFGSLTTGALANADKVSVGFGKGNIKSVGNADLSFKFSTIEVGSLTGSNKVEMEFCGKSKIVLSSGLTALNMNQSYGTVSLKPAGFSGSYDISTSFGSVKDRANIGIQRTDKADEYGPDSDKHYAGGSGSGKVTIKSSFGNVVIGDAKPEDEEKDKKKEKNKTANL